MSVGCEGGVLYKYIHTYSICAAAMRSGVCTAWARRRVEAGISEMSRVGDFAFSDFGRLV